MLSSFTSESVTEGHPDKVADLISDRIVDAALRQGPFSRVACETLCKGGAIEIGEKRTTRGVVILAGEVTCDGDIDYDGIVRSAIRHVGYVDPADGFDADGVRVERLLTQQALEIGRAVGIGDDIGAGDQGMMFGYATDETPERMPLPILLAHRLAQGLAEDRKSGRVPWLRPDGKTQVTVEYADGRPRAVSRVLVSTQHRETAVHPEIEAYVREALVPRVLGDWHCKPDRIVVNPSGSFEKGGPATDCGLTGRKIIADTYGGMARHGGGAFSGKDATKVDRSGAYFCRHVARQVVDEGLARRVEVHVAYAIGRAEPFDVGASTFGTGDDRAVGEFVRTFDFRPGAIIRRLGLREPIFATTTNYGHFGRAGLPWEGETSAS